MKARTTKIEKLKPLGDRVYDKHRKMLRDIAKAKGISNANALRTAIEESHGRIKAKS